MASLAQMLSYGKPVMGLPLCQTELDEGVRYLDVLDHLQKMQAVGLFLYSKFLEKWADSFHFMFGSWKGRYGNKSQPFNSFLKDSLTIVIMKYDLSLGLLDISKVMTQWAQFQASECCSIDDQKGREDCICTGGKSNCAQF